MEKLYHFIHRQWTPDGVHCRISPSTGQLLSPTQLHQSHKAHQDSAASSQPTWSTAALHWGSPNKALSAPRPVGSQVGSPGNRWHNALQDGQLYRDLKGTQPHSLYTGTADILSATEKCQVAKQVKNRQNQQPVSKFEKRLWEKKCLNRQTKLPHKLTPLESWDSHRQLAPNSVTIYCNPGLHDPCFT